MTEYVRTAKAEECITDAKAVLKALIEPEHVEIQKRIFNQEVEIFRFSPFSSIMNPDRPLLEKPVGPNLTTTSTSFEGAVIAGLVADIIKPHYDTCMGGEPTFVPKKPDAGRSK